METVDCLVIGAGIIGVSIARKLGMDGREVIVVEAEDGFGRVTSSRNSEVIHAGIYYPKDSLMARLCVNGRRQLYNYCSEHHVEHKRCGKLIVATSPDEVGKLEAIASHARLNGVDDISFVSRDALEAMEPALEAHAALFSPSTGIVDSHALMLELVGDAEAHGVNFAYGSPFEFGHIDDRIVVRIGGKAPITLACKSIVNAAGLYAPSVARNLRGFPRKFVPDSYFAKGNYFALSGARAPFSRLIYPVPVKGGLGVHLTLDLAGQARFGPDVQWVDAIDYEVDPARCDGFYEAIRRYWPGLPDNSLVPAYSGIRPKIVPPDIGKQDFMISTPSDHGVDGVVHLFGIESPGLTASLAIADYVAKIEF